ncbi:MAG TPA: UDP-N-acetylglucosamine 2-epimerase (hydrolyzing) [Candidatus Peribacter riflensis]|uniref:UDP-N-acetylglucosamine 2-epimerase n=1 Tax=Candidatus Peribacter riflensis TaxID=1735162 RepID=A0A0S1SHZ2_9BACT|nr:MAG: UDP-N-acetylglucosamine 2-epimerase [Candidatus Peribacter riflensis]OGJ78501.1 MAG: UDP-N-acetyl-D-glucosamine 2-epimerase, UDP-hydrolysing [Candidatus Peribacteria bacterium RIFOXYB1_FULL_57_12]OGJ82255.1 MAG: UDP-N-acetyl-D-glucosamine 2-epimerase, UDP-hydrolysing [Candidatus Peribacteria bacterium RIFOXYC1_FULL_58_8]ALM11408.1 MAG: UDP-N-acetylglucosamine 2-epimerase [Candidatus Peribacter riflensis]ALM12510.1 MAG: UDP-N-acetylglucosamine 2-epimerase [Candidatus Peribacter riflensis
MRKILVVIERRADYSRYRPVLQLLKADPSFDLHLVVTGINLLPGHGEDIEKIKADGFTVHTTIPMFTEHSPDSGAEMVRGISRVLSGIVDILEEMKPDLVLTGFDIGANFATTVAAAHMNIPVAHIQGGEVTGSIDESLRHAMSKFAHIHFPATEDAKRRLVSMGEDPAHIFVVGCPSLDVLINAPAIPKEQLEQQFHVDLSKPTVVLIQHPVTTENLDSRRQIEATLAALKEVEVQIIALLPNNDAGFSKIVQSVRQSGLQWFPSIDVVTFANLYRHISAIVGNSSSGIHEAATFHIPTINIGTRQQGRERPVSVIDVGYDTAEIVAALRKALFDAQYRQSLTTVVNPYGDGHTAPKIYKVLKEISLTGIIQKKFYE